MRSIQHHLLIVKKKKKKKIKEIVCKIGKRIIVSISQL